MASWELCGEVSSALVQNHTNATCEKTHWISDLLRALRGEFRSRFTMNEDSTEHEYLLTTQKYTWEDVHLFEDSFGPLTCNDNCSTDKNKWENHLSLERTANEENIVPSLMDSNSDEIIVKNKQHENIDSRNQGKTEIYINPSIVGRVRVLLASIEVDKLKNNSNVHQVFCHPPLHLQPKFNRKTSAKHNHICSICHKHFPSKSKLTTHFKSHTGEKPFSCPQCEKTFAKKGHLNQHILIHSGVKSFSCNICHKAFRRRWNLTSHRRVHTGEKAFSCPQCDEAFAHKGSLKQHLLIHSGVKPFSCDICHKAFRQKGTLTKHRRVHTGEKPFSCPQCEATFADQGNLNKHLLIHSGAKTFSCNICHKAFTLRWNLTTHRRIHTGEKPFNCPQCKETFAHKGSLNQHLLIHAGVKQFSCDICHKAFRQRGHLTKHCRVHTR